MIVIFRCNESGDLTSQLLFEQCLNFEVKVAEAGKIIRSGFGFSSAKLDIILLD